MLVGVATLALGTLAIVSFLVSAIMSVKISLPGVATTAFPIVSSFAGLIDSSTPIIFVLA